MPGPENEPNAAPSFHFVNTPWWRWNLATLAVVLFVFLWIREITVLSHAATWFGALVIIGLWAVYPIARQISVASLLRELVSSATRARPTRAARRRAALCRVAAVACCVAFVVQLMSTWMMIDWMLRQTGSLFGNWGVFAMTLLQPVGSCVVYVSAAIALWTIADVCVAVDRMQPSDSVDQAGENRARQPSWIEQFAGSPKRQRRE